MKEEQPNQMLRFEWVPCYHFYPNQSVNHQVLKLLVEIHLGLFETRMGSHPHLPDPGLALIGIWPLEKKPKLQRTRFGLITLNKGQRTPGVSRTKSLEMSGKVLCMSDIYI
jgi:hypothetical protein